MGEGLEGKGFCERWMHGRIAVLLFRIIEQDSLDGGAHEAGAGPRLDARHKGLRHARRSAVWVRSAFVRKPERYCCNHEKAVARGNAQGEVSKSVMVREGSRDSQEHRTPGARPT